MSFSWTCHGFIKNTLLLFIAFISLCVNQLNKGTTHYLNGYSFNQIKQSFLIQCQIHFFLMTEITWDKNHFEHFLFHHGKKGRYYLSMFSIKNYRVIRKCPLYNYKIFMTIMVGISIEVSKCRKSFSRDINWIAFFLARKKIKSPMQ